MPLRLLKIVKFRFPGELLEIENTGQLRAPPKGNAIVNDSHLHFYFLVYTYILKVTK